LGLLICQGTIAAVCLANRHRSVRAAAAADMDAAREAMETVGANLLVVDPERIPRAEFIRLATFFCRQGPRPCPEELRTRLE
jgi:ribose 5-phosphate isomerase RpiB